MGSLTLKIERLLNYLNDVKCILDGELLKHYSSRLTYIPYTNVKITNVFYGDLDEKLVNEMKIKESDIQSIRKTSVDKEKNMRNKNNIKDR